jgi:hypothetical protein
LGTSEKHVNFGKIVGDADWPAVLDEETDAVCRSILADPGGRL